MKSKSFSDELKAARDNGYAVGAFNIFNHLSARAVIRGASMLDCPVILQTSTGTVKKFGPQDLAGMLRQMAWNASVNVIIHLDHCQDTDLAKACIDAGWDSVMYDGSRLPLEENIANCRTVTEYAHRRNVQVEGELGTIAGVEEEISVEGSGTHANVADSLRFVRESGIDAFAPAIGTAHGMYKGVPKIDFDLVRTLNQELDTPLVIHGGTGLDKKTFSRLILSGGSKINVSTALKHAYLDTMKQYAAENKDKTDPLGFDQVLEAAIEKTVMEHIETFRHPLTEE